MIEENTSQNYNKAHDVCLEEGATNGVSNIFDDDGRLKRTGTVLTTSAHIITAVIGSGVLSLSWSIAQLGWVGGPIVMILFAFITYYTSTLLAECYRTENGKRNYTYMDAVRANLGGFQVKVCGAIQYINIVGIAIGYTIAASTSMVAVKRSNCFHSSHHKDLCKVPNTNYMIIFGVAQILFSQIKDLDQTWWLSIVAAILSFTYSAVGLVLGVGKVAESGKIKGSLTGISTGTVTKTNKILRSFNALGAIAFAYAYSQVLVEIEDTIKSPPAEHKTMIKSSLISVSITTVFYLLCGCFGYAAFGDLSPGNLLTGFGFYNPYWLVDIANAAIAVHLIGGYQVYCQPLFAFVEKSGAKLFPDSKFISKEYEVPVYGFAKPIKLNLFRLIWRTLFVVFTTVISMIMPFFTDVAGILGALGFWPLTVYFPVKMYIAQKNIPKWSTRWMCLQALSVACLIISLAAAVGSFDGLVTDLKISKPFKKTLAFKF